MARILLLHSTYGLRPGVHAAADRLRAAGHEVVTPDLFDGRTSETVEAGLVIRDDIGRDELLRRAVTAATVMGPGPLVHAGFSFGASIAQNLALHDERAAGLLLLHGTSDLPPDEPAWPAAPGLPVQLHVAEPDPFETEDWLGAWYLRMRKANTDVEVHRYHGAGHLFTDADLPDYDAEAAERCWRIATAFLDESTEG